MKIHIDTENKTIKVEERVSLNELMQELAKIFPDGEWREWDLEPMVKEIINWYPNYPTYPIIADPTCPTSPIYPFWYSTYTSSDGTLPK